MSLSIPESIQKLFFTYTGEHPKAQPAIVYPSSINGSLEMHMSLVSGQNLATLKRDYEIMNRGLSNTSKAAVEAKKYLSALNFLSLIQNPQERSQAIYLLLEALDADPAVKDWWIPTYQRNDPGKIVLELVVSNLEKLIPDPKLRQKLLEKWVQRKVFLASAGLDLILNKGETLVPDKESRKMMITHFICNLPAESDIEDELAEAESLAEKYKQTPLCSELVSCLADLLSDCETVSEMQIQHFRRIYQTV